jgi:Protein of unknown function (DUF3667)
MTITCLNCGHHFKGNYCPECGQKASVKRLTAAVLLEEFLHFFTHLETGFLFTSWNFIVRPGISSLNFVAGKRKNYQKPVSYFLIWTGLFILIHNAIINYYHYHLTSEIVTQLNIREQSNIFFRQHFTFFIIPVILVSAILLYYIMARPGFNFIELLALCLYGAGSYFMMSFLSDFVLGVILKVNILAVNVFLWQAVLSSVYNFWFSYDVFKRLHLHLFWLRLLTVSILVAVSGWVLMFYLPMAWIYFTG